MAIDIEMVAKNMTELAVGIDDVRVEVDPEDPDDVRTFLAWLSSDLSSDAAKSLCRSWARLIRRSLPDRPEGWSSSIVVILPLGSPLGVYFVGWAGHDDVWESSDASGETDSREWSALYRRLEEYLRDRGWSDSEGRGDYFLLDEDHGNSNQSLTIYRIEFLTPDLVSGIQDILRDGYSTWAVYVVLDLLPPVEGVSSDGLQICADCVIETWNRTLLVERLGARLKV